VRRPRSDGAETRQRLLAAAAEIFASRGFRAARVAGICRRAGANAAAVNYYFGSKRGLYVEAWRHAFARSIGKHPPDGHVSAGAPPEERLRGRVLSLMHRILDPDSHDLDIIHKEMASPTGLLAGPMRQALEPLREGLTGIVRELLGPGASEQQVRLCRMSVISQCFGPLLRERRRRESPRAGHPVGGEALPADVETLADHVVRFSLAGIRAIRGPAAVGPSSRAHKGNRP
jgi:AcrR family transcriptional regulator